MPINENMQVYKNKENKRPEIIEESNHVSNKVHESKLSMNLHTGSHVDAPLHMLENGATMDAYDLEQFIGKAVVIDLSQIEGRVIEKHHLINQPILEGDVVLMKTANSNANEFEFDFVYLSGSGAHYLSELGVKAVGIDALGIERNAPGHPAHQALLSKNIPIIEGLVLGHVKAGTYGFMALPIKIEGVEASPVRAVLTENTEG